MDDSSAMPNHGHLPRLEGHSYQGFSFVHWTMTLEARATGWLTSGFHSEFREILLHSLGRYHSVSPVYCLMPDHLHLLVLGVSVDADQLRFARHLRTHVNAALQAIDPRFRLQKQPYDSVLRDADRERGSFESLVYYVRENPVRAGLVARTEDWQFAGCMIPGYPEFSLREEDFWLRFWRYYASRLP